MIYQEPILQTKLFGLKDSLNDFVQLYDNDKLPNKILLTGQKGVGKATLAFHFINYVLSKNEEFNYDFNNLEINPKNSSYVTLINKSNPNITLIDINDDKKTIDISQIRKLISNLQKYSFNDKPRFVLIDNIDSLSSNSINALLKILEEPANNVYFFLINHNKKILSTLLSRCINFKIFLSNKQSFDVAHKLLNRNINDIINKDLINYYLSPGNIYRLVKFSETNKYDLKNMNLKEFLRIIINDKHYKKEIFIKYFIYDFIEFYLNEIRFSLSFKIHDRYNSFLKRISDIKRFNLDDESLFIEFKEDILNG